MGRRGKINMQLPEFWQFLQFGWWILHILAVVIIYFLGVGHGRKQALRQQERRRNPEPPAA